MAPVTGGGYGAWPKEARTIGYYGYVGVPTDVVHADQAMVSGHVGWTGQSTATGYREPGGRVEPAVPDGRRTGLNMARVAGSNVDTASQTPSLWAGVEPAKLYTGVGTSYLDAGATGVLQQCISNSRSSCDRPCLLNWRVVNSIIHWSLTQVQEWLLRRTGITLWSHGFEPHKDNRRVLHPMLQHKAGKSGANQLNQSMIPPDSHPQATSTRAVGRGSRQMLKLQHYDGTDSLETFLHKFHSMSRYLQWNKDDAM